MFRVWMLMIILSLSVSAVSAQAKDEQPIPIPSVQTMSDELAKRLEPVWTDFMGPLLETIMLPPELRPNSGSLMIVPPSSQFPVIYQVARDTVSYADKMLDIYVIRVSDSQAWGIAKQNDQWRIHPATVNKDGEITVKMDQGVKQSDLVTLYDRFVPGINNTDTVFARRFKRVIIKLTPNSI
jgi:hypothetical protein